MENAPGPSRLCLLHDLKSVAVDTANGVVSARARSASSMWTIWCAFCTDVRADPLLQCLADPIPILQVFALRYRRGSISASGAPTRKRQVEEALRAVGQALTALGLPDPRFAHFSNSLDFRLKRQLVGYKRLDLPPQRVKPIPLPVLRFAVDAASRRLSPLAEALSDLIVLAFFYLLRPGEYAHSASLEAAPFRLQDVHLFCGARKLNIVTSSDAALQSATYSGLAFSNQKNGVLGEVIGLGRSALGDRWCPVDATVRRVIALRSAGAPPSTPLHAFFHQGRWCVVSCSLVTDNSASLSTSSVPNTVFNRRTFLPDPFVAVGLWPSSAPQSTPTLSG